MEYLDVGGVTRIPGDFALNAPPQYANDGYPAVFHDQRTMLAGGLGGHDPEADESWGPCETGEEMFWNVWVRHLRTHQGIAPVIDGREVVPYLNAGRWIADCPECPGAMACWDRNPYACCLGIGCGRMFKVQWQPPAVRSEVMRILAGWPEGNRNWEAHRGETVEELEIQGVLMLGVPAVERNGLLLARNVHMPEDFTDVNEYLETLRIARRKGLG